MLCACTIDIEVFPHASVFSHLSVCTKDVQEKEKKKTETENRNRKSLHTLRFFAFMTSTSYCGENFSDHTCDELSSLFFHPETCLRSGASVSGPIKEVTTAWTTSKIEISRTASGYAQE